MIEADNKGLRYNEGKAPIHLVPPEAITALAQHYGRGAAKYKERNWEKGMKFSHCYNSMMRHALAWQQGEDYDAETGTHHMISAAWNALALFVYCVRKIGEDDRPRYGGCFIPEELWNGTYRPINDAPNGGNHGAG